MATKRKSLTKKHWSKALNQALSKKGGGKGNGKGGGATLSMGSTIRGNAGKPTKKSAPPARKKSDKINRSPLELQAREVRQAKLRRKQRSAEYKKKSADLSAEIGAALSRNMAAESQADKDRASDKARSTKEHKYVTIRGDQSMSKKAGGGMR